MQRKKYQGRIARINRHCKGQKKGAEISVSTDIKFDIYSYTQIASGVQTSTGSELKSQKNKCTGHQKADPSKYTEPLLSKHLCLKRWPKVPNLLV